MFKILIGKRFLHSSTLAKQLRSVVSLSSLVGYKSSDYKTLAAYALIKIDYPPHKKQKLNKIVNKSVKEDNRMRMQFFQINPTS